MPVLTPVTHELWWRVIRAMHPGSLWCCPLKDDTCGLYGLYTGLLLDMVHPAREV